MSAPHGRMIAAFAAVYLIWGSTYLFMRFAVESIPPLAMSGFRFLSAGLLLYALTRWRAPAATALPAGSLPRHAAVGILLTAGNATISWAVTRVPSGVVSLFVAMTPCWMVLFEWLRRGGRRPAAGVIAGVVLGVAGTLLLIGPPALGGERVDPLGAGISLLGTLSWAAGSIYSRGIPKAHSSFHSSAVQLVFGGGVVLLFAVLDGSLSGFDWRDISARSAIALVYLVIAGSLVAFSAYMYLLSVTTPALVSTYAFVNPVVAVLLGALFAGERVSGRIAAAGAVIVAAVVLITVFSSDGWRRRRTRTETLPTPVREFP